MPHCKVAGCRSGSKTSRLRYKKLGLKHPSLFRAPKDPDLFKKWEIQIPTHSKLSKKDGICELHFHQDDIERYYITNLTDGSCSKIERGIPKLKEGAIPRFFPNLQKQLPKKSSALAIENFGGILSDTVVNIKEEPLSDEGSVNSNCLSRFQKENETFMGVSSDKACSVNEQPVTNDEVVSINCSSSRLKREHETFNCISSEKACSVNKQPATNNEIVNINCSSRFVKEDEAFNPISCDKARSINEQPVTNDEEVNINCSSTFLKENEAFNPMSSDTAHNIEQPVTKNNIGLIELPDEWWGINSTPKFIICTKWKDNGSPERRVIIENDSRVKIFIKDHEVPTDETLKNSSIGGISRLLCEVNAYKICPGIGDNSMTNCLIYDKDPRVKGCFSNLCKNCRQAKRVLHKKQRDRRRCEIKKFKRSKCFACLLAKAALRKRKDEESSPNTSIEPSVDTTADCTALDDYIVLAECLISGK